MTRSLHNNGALDPDQWRPSYDNTHTEGTPTEGDLVGWRYAAWTVHEIRPIADEDLTDTQRQRLQRLVEHSPTSHRQNVQERNRPYRIVLHHHRGPLIIKPGEAEAFVRLHDGTREVSLTTDPGRRLLPVLTSPYRVCSCHGHIWPCQDVDRDTLAQHQTRAMDKLLAGAKPGVCQACQEPVTARQKTVVYEGEHLDLPGGPSATFHTRAACRSSAVDYELRWLAADLHRERILSYPKCVGLLLVHADGGSECVPTTGWDGRPAVPAPDCRGHATHDHAAFASCYVHGCGRGCNPERNPGTGGLARRPERRPQSTALI